LEISEALAAIRHSPFGFRVATEAEPEQYIAVCARGRSEPAAPRFRSWLTMGHRRQPRSCSCGCGVRGAATGR
jgi:hypothetical protein